MRKLMFTVMASVMVFASLLEVTSASAEDQYNVHLFWIRGPLKTSGVWESWATEKVSRLYTDRTLTDDLDYRLKIGYITQPTLAVNKQSLWLATRITGKSGNKLSLNMLRFSEWSDDLVNTLGNSYSLVGGNYIYSPQALGVIWGASGENEDRASHAVINSGNANEMVDEVVFIGVQSPYYSYSSFAELANIDSYIKSFSNFSLSGKVEVVTANNIILAVGSRRLQMVGTPPHPQLLIKRNADIILEKFLAEGHQRTGVIESSSRLGPTVNWTVESTANNGDEILRPADGRKFYR